jgi:NADPH2:quinone reductase
MKSGFRAVMADHLGPIDQYALKTLPHTPLGARNIRIAVKAAAVSFVDVLVATGRYQAKPTLPFIPGSECAGVVTELGSAVQGFSIGQQVLAAGTSGMFAECVTAPAELVWPMPVSFTYAEAASLLVSYATAWHALVDRGRLSCGETLLVLGAGGATGYAAVQLGKFLGARVIALASSDEKRAMALSGGAHAAFTGRAPDWREAVLATNAGKAIDVVFDPVGGDASEPAFRSLGYDGRHLVVGFTAGIAKLPSNLPLLKAASLIGVNLHAYIQAFPEHARESRRKLLELATAGHLRPVVAKSYALEDFAQAMADAASGKRAGRIVLALG